MITVQGTFLKADGSPETGSLEFYSKTYVLESAGTTTVVPSVIKATLNAQGYISINVPSTDDPEWTPSGWTYTLVFKLSGDYSTIHVAIPYDSPNGILPVTQLVPVTPTPPSNGGGSGGGNTGNIDASQVTSGVLSIARIPVGTTHSQVAFGDHIHDDRYYTETEVNAALSLKVNLASLSAVATSGSYLDLTNKPTIPTVPVTSVAGKTGDVALTKSDVGLANVTNTSDANKPVSTAQQTALNAKADITSLAAVATSGNYADLSNKPNIPANPVSSVAGRTGDVTLSKSDVGLANVDNTSDLAKPVSTATQTALNAKANTSSLAAVATSGSYNDLIDKPTGGGSGAVSSVAGRTGDVTLTKSDVGLSNVDNTADTAKPVSTATQTALNGKANTAHTHSQSDVTGLTTALAGKADSSSLATVATSGSYTDLINKPTIPTVPVTSVAGKTGDVSLVKADVGLANVDNTADVDKPIGSATQTALNGKEATGVASSLVTAHNSATTSVHGIADTSQLVTQSQMSSAIAGIDYPVDTVAGRAGDVVLTKSDVGLANVDNTADTAKPVSSAQQTALNLKAPLASPTFTGTVAGITKSMVGLGNVDNTADTAKPVSTAQQSALDLKAPLASPTFTGTVSGISKSMVGLGNVDNTADTAKPVSTAQQTALNAKVDKTSYPGLIVLGPSTAVPGGTASGTVIVRTTS